MFENIRTYCKAAINRFNSTKLWVVALCLFLINLMGYTAFRYSISDDIFGGDTVNVASRVMDSYTLKESNLIGDTILLYKMLLEGKNGDIQNNHNSFIYHLFSQKGKEVIERLIKNPANERDKEIFLLEFNRSVVEKEIDWPDPFLKASIKNHPQSKANMPIYNLQVLSWLYPNNIRDNMSPLYQWKYDLSSMIRTFPKVALAYFTINAPTRYSPLTNIYVTTVQMYMQNSPERTIITVALTGIIYSTLIVLVFLLAEKITKSILWSLFAAFIFQASVSTIQSTYQLFSLPYMFVPLVMVGAIYAYLQYKDSGKVVWLMLFFYLSILAPWFREFPGVIPFIVFASEVLSFRGRRSVVMLILCAFLMIHSVYPTWLPWLIGLNQGGVYNVFSQGNVKHLSNIPFLNLQSIGLLFVQFPPTLWGIVLISIGYWLWRSFIISREKKMHLSLLGKNASIAVPDSNFLRLLPLLSLIVIVCGFIYSFFIANRSSDYYVTSIYSIFLIPLIASVTLVSFRFNTILPIYFAATFIPFLRISLAELHLSFTLIPLSIIFSLWAKDLFSSIAADSKERTRKIALALLFGLLGIGIVDQFLNIPSSYFVQKRLVDTNREMAAWLKNNTPKHSIVVTNFYNFTDVFYYSDYHFAPYETVENCPMGTTRVVHKDKDFENLFKKNFGVRDVYLLAADHEFPSNRKAYHSHKYVKNPPGELEKLTEFSAKSIYYYFDPIKYFIPRYFVSFIGYMDWVTDFYFNNEPEMFKRKVYADYTIYKLKDVSKGFVDEQSVPQLVGGGPPRLAGAYKEYNIVDYDGDFYGVPQSMGTLDLSKEKDRSKKGILVGKDRKEIKQLIENAYLKNDIRK